jgi:predicted phosphodiesterase
MKRGSILLFKKISLTLILILVLYTIGRISVVSYDSYRHIPRQPYLQMQTYDSIRIKWQSPKSEIGCVKYGKDKADTKICESIQTNKHTITVNGLEEGHTYIYEVFSDSLDIDNTNRRFTTLHKDKQKKQNIWIIGDSGQAGPGQRQVLQSMQTYMKDKALDMWILLGDNAYRSGTQEQYTKALFEPYKELLKDYVPWAVIGNHDARRWAFYDIFDFPSEAESGGIPSHNKKFYSIEQGDLHILMIDSETTDLSKDSELLKWLEKDLQANTKKWTVAIFHHPPYTHGGHNSDNPRDSHYKFSMTGRLFLVRENIIPVLEKYDVDLVYSGHSHVYERSKLIHKHYQDSTHFNQKLHVVQDNSNTYCKNLEKTPYAGTVYTVMGSSSKLDKGSLNHPALPIAYEKMGSVILEVTPEALHSSFISINGKIEDSFSLYKKESCSNL